MEDPVEVVVLGSTATVFMCELFQRGGMSLRSFVLGLLMREMSALWLDTWSVAMLQRRNNIFIFIWTAGARKTDKVHMNASIILTSRACEKDA